MRFASIAAVTLALTGCGLLLDLGPPDEVVDPMDAGRRDAGGDARDAGGIGLDAERPTDARARDARPSDATLARDTGAPDANLRDGSIDSCMPSAPTDCLGHDDCEGEDVCVRPRGQCFGLGTCVNRAICSSTPVCGCNGRSYASHCEALADGVSVLHDGACVPHGYDYCDVPPSRLGLPCATIWSACFDDSDCDLGGSTQWSCVGAQGCAPGMEGICLPFDGINCFRDDNCTSGRICEGAEIGLSSAMSGTCRLP